MLLPHVAKIPAPGQEFCANLSCYFLAAIPYLRVTADWMNAAGQDHGYDLAIRFLATYMISETEPPTGAQANGAAGEGPSIPPTQFQPRRAVSQRFWGEASRGEHARAWKFRGRALQTPLRPV